MMCTNGSKILERLISLDTACKQVLGKGTRRGFRTDRGWAQREKSPQTKVLLIPLKYCEIQRNCVSVSFTTFEYFGYALKTFRSGSKPGNARGAPLSFMVGLHVGPMMKLFTTRRKCITGLWFSDNHSLFANGHCQYATMQYFHYFHINQCEILCSHQKSLSGRSPHASHAK